MTVCIWKRLVFQLNLEVLISQVSFETLKCGAQSENQESQHRCDSCWSAK